MFLYAWNLNEQQIVLLRPWMRYCPWICTKHFNEGDWEMCLEYTLSEAQHTLVLEARKRAAETKKAV